MSPPQSSLSQRGKRSVSFELIPGLVVGCLFVPIVAAFPLSELRVPINLASVGIATALVCLVWVGLASRGQRIGLDLSVSRVTFALIVFALALAIGLWVSWPRMLPVSQSTDVVDHFDL